MFLLTVFVYPLVLAMLCIGAGLILDRVSGRVLPGLLLPVAGLATLIGLCQLSTAISSLAPASPYIVAVVGLSGLALERGRLRAIAGRARRDLGLAPKAAAYGLVYLIAIAPVLLAGRPSFSAYMVLTDSAYHLVGADYLIHHGRSLAHLDSRSSYGQVIDSYFVTAYPTGADTLFGATALLLRLPLIWAFQPFNAFALATTVGPAWLLLRRVGLAGGWLVIAALTVTLPALVYAYELIASVKEIVALPMLLGLGVLVVQHRRWLTSGPRGGIPFAVISAAGVSVLGVGFGAWVLAALVALGFFVYDLVARGSLTWRQVFALLGCLALTGFVFAAPTWTRAAGSLEVASTVAQTSNSGNLQRPLRPVQMLGSWLSGSYMRAPVGGRAALTDVLVGLTALSALLGALFILARRQWAIAAWLGGALVVWLGLTAYGTTWVNAKGLMLTSPVLMLIAWAGVGGLLLRARPAVDSRALRRSRLRRPPQMRLIAGLLAGLLAVAITSGVLLSDAIQYRDSPLAPTARYDELASLNQRFAGRGPTLFTDFDEYSMYELRALDVAGPDFLYPPGGLDGASEGHGYSVDLASVKPAALTRYPLLVARRNPLAYRPPAAYQLLWQGIYYQVWRRRPNMRPAVAVLPLHGAHPVGCRMIAPLARNARIHHATLVADLHPPIVQVHIDRVHHTAGWVRSGVELAMDGEGRLWAGFAVPRAGAYELWLAGEAMPTLEVRVDGRLVGDVGGEVSGNGDSPDPMVPLRIDLSAGRHALSVERGGFSFAPGSGSEAYLEAIFLDPAGAVGEQRLRAVAPARWRSLCGQHLDWIEAVPR
jgi:hypothetical protein